MSGITGFAALDAGLTKYEAALRRELGRILAEEAVRLQAEIVAMIPVKTGKVRDLLSRPDAIELTHDDDGNVSGFAFGFLTKETQKAGYYYLWVETGRGSGTKGGTRRAGKDKKGKQRIAKIKRTFKAIQPRRIFAIGFVRLEDRMAKLRDVAKGRALTG